MEIRIVIDEALIASCKNRLFGLKGGGRTRWLLLTALVLLPLSLLARSDASLYPIVFSPDTIISSSDVNANFSEAFRQLRYVLEDDTEKLGALSLLDGNLGVNTNQPGASVGIEGSLSKLLTGKALIGSGNTSVQGIATLFKSEVAAGDALKLDDEVFTVASVSSDTALTVTVAARQTHADAIPYTDEPLLSLKNGADASKLVVDRSGNLGIGTATPAAKLEVSGPIYRSCTEGDKRGRWSVNGHCYMVFNTTKNFSDARIDCENRGGYLVTLTSAAEQSHVLSLTTKNFWIGYSDVRVEGQFEWINGEIPVLGNDAVFQYWWAGEPNNGLGGPVEDCSFYGYDVLAWIDAPCNDLFSYVCERNY